MRNTIGSRARRKTLWVRVPHVSKLLCSRVGFERRSDVARGCCERDREPGSRPSERKRARVVTESHSFRHVLDLRFKL